MRCTLSSRGNEAAIVRKLDLQVTTRSWDDISFRGESESENESESEGAFGLVPRVCCEHFHPHFHFVDFVTPGE